MKNQKNLHDQALKSRPTWTWPLTATPEVVPEVSHKGMHDGGWKQGMPLGGIGTGGIVRNCRGAFSRWSLKAGALKNFVEPACMFSVRAETSGKDPRAYALHPGHPLEHSEDMAQAPLSSWNWDYDGKDATCNTLFPKTWMHYPAMNDMPVEMVCEQFSPVIPEAYRESSLPVAVFSWQLKNTSTQPVRFSLMFSFVNILGWFDEFGQQRPEHKNGGNYNESFRQMGMDGTGTAGILMNRMRPEEKVNEGMGQICISSLCDDRRTVTMSTTLFALGNGNEVWDAFASEGMLNHPEKSFVATPGQILAGAVCMTVELAPGEEIEAPFALAWDLPIIQFGSGREHLRQYTRYFDTNGNNAQALANEALRERDKWSEQIDAWHRDVISASDHPDWYYSFLFNEAYLLVDGLTIWTNGTRGHPEHDPFFGIIECPDYPYYCTLDLWIYGSFILLKYWPELEKNTIRRFAETTLVQYDFYRKMGQDGTNFSAKERGMAPHDFGEPMEDPQFMINSYINLNSNKWKDLNCHFVLTLYRDVTHLDDNRLLKECWPAARCVMEKLLQYDNDNDGMIENDGLPDQTMDGLRMKGISSYCGGLWLGAMQAALEMAKRIGDHEFVEQWTDRFSRGRDVFEKELWTGSRYRFDTEGNSPEALFTDAMFGIWFAGHCGLPPLISPDRLKRHLMKVYETNFLKEGRGFGAVNVCGWKKKDTFVTKSEFYVDACHQVNEILSGLNISLVCQLRSVGLETEAETLLKTLYEVIYKRFGLWFRTPAAWLSDGRIRAILNLRPLIIWALEFHIGKSIDQKQVTAQESEFRIQESE